MKKHYDIRYNTHSTDSTNRWRLIDVEKKEEILVADIIITSTTYTTSAWMEDLQTVKYHISCEGVLDIKNNVAYITTSDKVDSVKRHLFKTVSYRILATSITIATAYLLGVNLEMSALLGVGELVIKPVFYFLHERVWYNLRFRKK